MAPELMSTSSVRRVVLGATLLAIVALLAVEGRLRLGAAELVRPAVSTADELEQGRPPGGSPAAQGQHPRIFFTQTDLPAIRAKIAGFYKDEFQQFLDLLGRPEKLTRRQRAIASHWGSLNYAFVAALDPDELRRSGFRLPADLGTKGALCDRAMRHVRDMLPTLAKAPVANHNYLTTGYPRPLMVPVMAAYDWCFDSLTDGDKQAIVDTFVTAFERRYATRDPRNLEIKGLDRLANNQASAGMQDLLPIVAFWGDPYATPEVQRTMYRYFETIWLGRLLAELDVLYADGAGWHEGPGGYFAEGFVNLAWGFAAFSKALGLRHITELPFFTRQGEFLLGLVKPMTVAANCGNGRERCPRRFERWGAMSGGIAGPSCRQTVLAAGLLHAHGGDGTLLKWGIDELLGGCTTLGKRFGGAWANAVFYWFLFGDRDIPASQSVDTLPLSLKHGLGVYSMKTNYLDPAATHVVFFAQPVNTYGHGTWQYGDFSLSKYGNLVVQAANRKSGDGNLRTNPSAGSLFRNVLTVHRGENDPTLSVNGSGPPAPQLSRYGITRIRRVGTVRAESLNSGGFDYISYDNSEAFREDTATLSQREFVYIRGPENSEYLVLLDRFNAVAPEANDKVWRIWVPHQPEFVNGTGTQPRPGKWTSSDSDLIRLTNQFEAMESRAFKTGPTSGRFYLRTLLPTRPVINFIGGPGMEFQNGNDDGTTTWGAPRMTQAMREYLGWGRIEVRPSHVSAYDVFLNVIQFGNARTLTRPSEMQLLESRTSGMTGVHLRDEHNEWVVMFASDRWPSSPRTSAHYRIRPAAKTSEHLLVNMGSSTPFAVRAQREGEQVRVEVTADRGGTEGIVRSSAAGVLRFTLHGTAVSPTDELR